jgi:hypothetical protein
VGSGAAAAGVPGACAAGGAIWGTGALVRKRGTWGCARACPAHAPTDAAQAT